MLGSKIWPSSYLNRARAPTYQCNASCWGLPKTCTLAWFGWFHVQFLPFLAPVSSGKAFFYSTTPFYMAHYFSLQLHLQSSANSNYCLNCIYGKKKKVILFERRITCQLFSYIFGPQKNSEGKKRRKSQFGCKWHALSSINRCSSEQSIIHFYSKEQEPTALMEIVVLCPTNRKLLLMLQACSKTEFSSRVS